MSHICIIEDDTAIAEIERDYLEIRACVHRRFKSVAA